MDSLTFRPASEADVPFLIELRQATMAPHEAASGLPLSSAQSLLRVKAALHTAQIIMQDDHAIGLLKVMRDGLHWQLLQIQLAPASQRRGLGSQIVRGIIQEARSAGASLHLSVLMVNPALRLYERLGFVVVREKALSCEMALTGNP